jgi:muramoyltetrapeptide carboxypeptidase LdcA involved in peptidoglycan recycling
VVFGVDSGHAEPQYVIPSGGTVTIDSGTQRIEVCY